MVFNDAIGWTPALVRACHLTLTKKGDGLVFDFAGTSPENPSSYNVHPQAVVGHIANFFYEYLFHDLPICSSTFASIDFKFPEGIILNPDKSAATSCCVFIGMQTRCATHNSFAKMAFSSSALWRQIAAAPGSQHTSQICAGLSQWKLAVADVLSFSLNTMGQGGRAASDGMDAYGFAWCAFGRAPDSEQVESELPITVTLSQHWKDSCGHGLHRGGSGGVQQWMIHKMPDLVSMCMGNGTKVPLGQPLFGGYASAPIPGISVRKADLLERMQQGDPTVTLEHRSMLEHPPFMASGTTSSSRALPKSMAKAICYSDSAAAARAMAILRTQSRRTSRGPEKEHHLRLDRAKYLPHRVRSREPQN